MIEHRSFHAAKHLALIAAAAFGLALAAPSMAAYVRTDLVSDITGLAAETDPNLKNPWGISSSSSSPFWVADNGSGVSTLYNGTGAPFPLGSPLVVTIPPAPGSPAGTLSTPTGTVFNANAAANAFMGDRFLFATQDGIIAGWQGGTAAAVRVDSSPAGSIYTGLALSGGVLYASDFANNRIDAFDSDYNSLFLGGSAFTDPNLPSGFAPFNIQSLGDRLYVAYTQSDKGDEVPGPGNGLIDTFDEDGSLIQRLVVGIPGDPTSPLNAPWGLALAPPGFGEFANDLLVGNFGDGTIHAFDPVTGALLGTLSDAANDPIVIDGLWGLRFGNGGNGGDPNTLYFAAGIEDEQHGLFGSIAPVGAPPSVPEPGTIALLALALVLLTATSRKRCAVS